MKKFISILSLIALLCAVSVGCDAKKEPTAEELLQSAYPVGLETMKAEMELNFCASVSMEELGTDGNMEFSMNMNANMESNADTTLIDGKAKISLFGMTVEQSMKEYSQADGSEVTKYSYSEDNDTWTYVVKPAEEKDKERTMDPSVFRDLKLQETKKDDTEYIVTASLYMEDLSKLMDIDMESIMNLADEELDYSNIAFNVEFAFDKATKNIKSFDLELIEPYSKDKTEISSLSLSMKKIEFSSDIVKIPNDVIRNAIDEYGIDDSDVAIPVPESMDASETVEGDIEESLFSSHPMEVVDEDFDTAQAGTIEESVEEENNEGMSNNMPICEAYFNLDYVYEEDLLKIAKGKLEEGEEVNLSIMSFLSYYTKEEFLEYVEFWKYYTDRKKFSCAFLSYLDVVSYDEMVEAGADAEELKTLLEEIKNK